MGLLRLTYPITFNGRTFPVKEVRLIQTFTTDYAALGRTELAATLCELVDWRRPTGRLKTHEGRPLLAPLEAKGLVTLPPAGAQPPMVPDIAFYHPRLRDYLLGLVIKGLTR